MSKPHFTLRGPEPLMSTNADRSYVLGRLISVCVHVIERSGARVAVAAWMEAADDPKRFSGLHRAAQLRLHLVPDEWADLLDGLYGQLPSGLPVAPLALLHLREYRTGYRDQTRDLVERVQTPAADAVEVRL